MSASNYLIAPLPLPPGPSPTVPVRQDLNLYLGTRMLELFLEAMQNFMQMDNLDNELSYFRIAAIHGAPYVGWGRCPSPGKTTGNGNFCVHNNVTFPTFHRVYMMLFEQRLYEIMTQIISQKPASEQAEWTAMQQNWRLPTWNWGTLNPMLGEYSVPDIYMLANWPPSSTTPNPLWKFINPVKDSSGNPVPMGSSAMGAYQIPQGLDYDWYLCKATSRHGAMGQQGPDEKFIEGINNYTDLNEELNSPDWNSTNPDDPKNPKDIPTGSIKELVYHMLTANYRNYASFASTKWYKDLTPAEAINLEYIHNNIHNFTGGCTNGEAGHMEDIAVAAFDPIFWQHHAYIDELFAIWQALPQNKDHWFDNPFPGTPPDPLPTDDLDPFNFSDSRLYNSNDVQRIASLNYDYKFPKDPFLLTAWVNNTFGVSRSEILHRARDLPGKKNSYVANVIYDKYALSGSYNIYFFFGQVSADIETSAYRKQKNYVGIVATFGNRVEHCANCEKQKQEGALSRAQIMLTVPLLNIALDKEDTSLPQNNLKLGGEEDNGVWHFLKNNLSYKVVGPGGVAVQNDDERLKDLKVTVLAGKATHYEDDTKLSKFEDYRSLFTMHQTGYLNEDPWNTPHISLRAADIDD